jgi:hypothetical protein
MEYTGLRPLTHLLTVSAHSVYIIVAPLIIEEGAYFQRNIYIVNSYFGGFDVYCLFYAYEPLFTTYRFAHVVSLLASAQASVTYYLGRVHVLAFH